MGETYQRKVHKETLKIEICVDLLEKVSNDSIMNGILLQLLGVQNCFSSSICVFLCRAISRLLQWDYHMTTHRENQRGQDTLHPVCENWDTDFFSENSPLLC